MIIWAIWCIKDIIECLYSMIWPLFRFLGRNLSKFFVGFLKNVRHKKDILKLTDLYILFLALRYVTGVQLLKFLVRSYGENKKWVSNWANIGPKWPNVKYDVAFLWPSVAKVCAEGSGDMVFVQEVWWWWPFFAVLQDKFFFCDMVFIMVLVLVLVFWLR